MKKKTTTKKTDLKVFPEADWKKIMTESTDSILLSLDTLLTFLQKNKRKINKDVKAFGAKGSGTSELFDKLILNVDKKINEIWDIVEEE